MHEAEVRLRHWSPIPKRGWALQISAESRLKRGVRTLRGGLKTEAPRLIWSLWNRMTVCWYIVCSDVKWSQMFQIEAKYSRWRLRLSTQGQGHILRWMLGDSLTNCQMIQYHSWILSNSRPVLISGRQVSACIHTGWLHFLAESVAEPFGWA